METNKKDDCLPLPEHFKCLEKMGYLKDGIKQKIEFCCYSRACERKNRPYHKKRKSDDWYINKIIKDGVFKEEISVYVYCPVCGDRAEMRVVSKR